MLKITVRITVDGRSGVCRKSFDEIPAKEVLYAAVNDAAAQCLINFAEKPKKAVKKAAKKAKSKA